MLSKLGGVFSGAGGAGGVSDVADIPWLDKNVITPSSCFIDCI